MDHQPAFPMWWPEEIINLVTEVVLFITWLNSFHAYKITESIHPKETEENDRKTVKILKEVQAEFQISLKQLDVRLVSGDFEKVIWFDSFLSLS